MQKILDFHLSLNYIKRKLCKIKEKNTTYPRKYSRRYREKYQLIIFIIFDVKFYAQFIKGLKFRIQSETSLRNSFRGFHRGDDEINRKTRDSQISLFLRIPCAVSCIPRYQVHNTMHRTRRAPPQLRYLPHVLIMCKTSLH